MSLNMDAVFQKLGEATQSVEDKITQQINNMDPSNTADVLKLQQLMQRWSIAVQIQTNTVKTISEGLRATVQNIR